MFSRFRPFRSGGLWRPSQNTHSLEYLKYLHGVLSKNKTVTVSNRETLIEALRAMSEILIWGDQNDGSVFDFFLEKNMLEFFLLYLEQKSGRYICVQILQTLNILFENIRNDTSLYYLLSNNHINSIIVHKFDFSDEEVLAYYISFLKTLSLKLNQHTIHFFYNEHTNDFPLYTEAIKFFNHSESMVRIAVRTLTLNVYKVPDASMLRFIRDHTAAPYFSNFVWFVGNHILEIDSAIRNDSDHSSRDRLSDLVAEHLDHLHYLNDILRLEIESLNDVLTDHLLDRLFLPLYIQSLFARKTTRRSRIAMSNSASPSHENFAVVTQELALYLLTQVFLIITHPSLVRQLADIIFNTDVADLNSDQRRVDEGGVAENRFSLERPESLDEALPKLLQTASAEAAKPLKRPNYRNSVLISEGSREEEEDGQTGDADVGSHGAEDSAFATEEEDPRRRTSVESADDLAPVAPSTLDPTPQKPSFAINPDTGELKDQLQQLRQELQNITDEEKVAAVAAASSGFPSAIAAASPSVASLLPPLPSFPTAGFTVAPIVTTFHAPYMRKIKDSSGTDLALASRPYLDSVFKALECLDNDYDTLFALTLIYAIGHNSGIDRQFTESTRLPTPDVPSTRGYNSALAERLIFILGQSCKSGSKVRLVTLDLAIHLLKLMSTPPPEDLDGNILDERHVGLIESARGEAVLYVRNFYKSEDLFLDMFEDEYREMKARPLNVSFLCMDASILLPPIGTPLSGIEFVKRLPCGESERARRAIRVFLYLRDVTLHLNRELETALPLTKESEIVRINDVLDLNNSDLIACTVILKEGKLKRFLVIGADEVILVEPDTKRLGWGMATFVGLLQDTEVEPDKEDTRSLYVTVHKRPQLSTRGSPSRLEISRSGASCQRPLLSARLIFDDHIRCMAARQRLSKGRHKARQRKMHQVARLLELSSSKIASSGHESSHARSRRPGTATSAVSASQRPGSASASTQRQQQLDRIRGLHSSSQRLIKEKGIAMATSVPGRVEAEAPHGWEKSGSVSTTSSVTSSLRYFDHRGIDIEEAEDAALSLQNLDKQENEGGKKRNESSGSNGSNNLESSEEIPLEDLSRLKSSRHHRKAFVSPTPLNSSVEAVGSLDSSRAKQRSRSATPPASASSHHRQLHRLTRGTKSHHQSRSQERPSAKEAKDEEVEELFGSREAVGERKGSSEKIHRSVESEKKNVADTAGKDNDDNGVETRVSLGRASASSNASSTSTNTPKSLTPAPIAPVSLVDDEVTISLEAMPLMILPPVPSKTSRGGGGGGGGATDAGKETFKTYVTLNVGAGAGREGDTTAHQYETTATPDSIQSPPSDATLMSCGSDGSPCAAGLMGNDHPIQHHHHLQQLVEKQQRIPRDAAQLENDDDDVEYDDHPSRGISGLGTETEDEEEMERRERKDAMLEASTGEPKEETADSIKKSLTG